MPRGGRNRQGNDRGRDNRNRNRNQGQKGPLLYFFERRQSTEGAKKETVRDAEGWSVKTKFKVATQDEKVVRFAINDNFLPDDETTSGKQGTYTFRLPIGFSQADLKIYLIGDTKERDTLHVVEDNLGQVTTAPTPTDTINISVTATDIVAFPASFVANIHILVNGKAPLTERAGKLVVEHIGQFPISADEFGHESFKVVIPPDFSRPNVRMWAIDESGKQSKVHEFPRPLLDPAKKHLTVDADVNEDESGRFYVKIRMVNDNNIPIGAEVPADASVMTVIYDINSDTIYGPHRFMRLVVPETGVLPVLVAFDGAICRIKFSLDETGEKVDVLLVKKRTTGPEVRALAPRR